MRTNDAVRVGLTVLIGIAVLIAASFWIRGRWSGGDTYTRKVVFENAQGIQEGAYVRVRGVTLGEVDDVSLNAAGRAIVTIRLSNDYQLKRDDSVRIVTGLTGFTPPYIEITPNGRRAQGEVPAGAVIEQNQPVPPDEVVVGETGTDTDRLLSKTEVLVDNMTQLSTQLNRLTDNFVQVVEDPKLRRNLTRTTENFARISDRGVVIAGNMEEATAAATRLLNRFQQTSADLSRTLRQTDALLVSLRGTSQETQGLLSDARSLVDQTRGVVEGSGELVQNTSGLVSDFRGFVTENRPRFQEVLDSLNTSLKSLDTTLAETRSFITDPELRGNLEATSHNLRDATENLKNITQDVRGLTGDPKVQEDLRATIAGLRDATQQASAVFERVRTVFGSGGQTAKSIGERIDEASVDAALLRTTRTNRTRLDVNATIPWSDTTFFRLGFFDFGETNRFNIQAGHQVRSGIWARYGIYASKLGLGLDVGNPLRPSFSANIFGVDNPQVNLYGNLPISRDFDLTAGFDDVTRRADPIFGIRYRR